MLAHSSLTANHLLAVVELLAEYGALVLEQAEGGSRPQGAANKIITESELTHTIKIQTNSKIGENAMTTNVMVDDIYKNRWLKADDIPDEGDLIVTVKDVNAEVVGQDKENKLVLAFREVDKELVLNKTNAKTLSDKYGKAPNEWIGKRLALYATEVDFAGKTTLGLRIRIKGPAQPAQRTEEAEY